MLKRIYDNKLAIFLFVLIVICTCIGLSYAYWKITMVQDNSNLVTSDCFSLEFTDENDITLQNAYPMYDEELINFFLEATPYHFTVTNKCNREMYYTINLESLLLENEVKKLSDRYVDIVLFDGNSSFKELYEAVISGDPEAESLYANFFIRPTILDMQKYGASFSINLSNLDINEEKVLPNAETAYIMKEEKIGANESKSYNLLLLMNYNTPAMVETMNATWEGRVTITSTYGEIPESYTSTMLQVRCVEQGIDTWTGKCEIMPDSFYQDGLKEKITKIIIQDRISPVAEAIASYDESFYKNGNVMSYVVDNGDGTYTVYLQSNGKMFLPPLSDAYFNNMPNLKQIIGLENLDVSNVKSMAYMFYGNTSLENIDFSGWNTSQVENFSGMFEKMSAIKELDLTSFDTSSAIDFFSMFRDMSNLTNIIYGEKWNTSSVTDMTLMFAGTSSIETLNLEKYDTSNVENMNRMFENAKKLKNIIYGEKWNTSNVKNMSSMFAGTSSIETLNLEKYDTSKVATMKMMFFNMKSLQSITFGEKWSTNEVMSFESMFSGCSSLTSLDLSSFTTSNVTKMSGMFSNASSLLNIVYGENFVKPERVDIDEMFENCPANKPNW